MTPEEATKNLLTSLETPRSRRGFLKGAVGASAAVAGAGLLPRLATSAHADDNDEIDPPGVILTIAAIAERLAITFYSNGIANADILGLHGQNLDDIKAFVIEEQIHENFFVAQGGKPNVSTFSFPHGADTFKSLGLFIQTQQQLEGAFDSAFIAAVYEFAAQNLPNFARIACMIAMIEEGHRTVGRQMIDLDPAEENAFAPQEIDDVNDAPNVLKAAGYLSPVPGNSYDYQPIDFTSPTYAAVYATIMNTAPFVAPET